MKAITREEKIMSGENLTPITRKELFLAKAAGQVVETPMPITREEMFLDKIQGGGGGGSTLPSQQKTIDITENGTVEVTPDYGYTLSKVTANVNVDGNLEVFVATNDVELFIVNEQGIFTLDEYVANQGGSSKAFIQLLDTLPEKLIASSVSNSGSIFYIYVIESTGIAYLNLGDALNNISVTAGQVLFTEAGSDKGWIDNIDSATEYGVYCVRKNSGLVDVDRISSLVEGDENCVYRLTEGLYYAYGGTSYTKQGKTYFVDKLPEVGEPFMDLTDMAIKAVYYNTSDKVFYAYITDEIAAAIETPVGWNKVETIVDCSTVTNCTSMTEIDMYYLLANTTYFIYKDGNWVELCAYCGDSGDEGGDSPSCLVVVINNSTDTIEVNTKQLVENNEVVDAVGTNFGYGEVITFENTQKGSVATLKTTLPCIVRDGGNPDIVYSNSEYVEVDEANQMTYVTIPEDSDTIEILVGE